MDFICFQPVIDFYLKPLAQILKSYIQDSNYFLKNIANLPSLSDYLILCTRNAVGLYPIIPHEKGLIAMMKALDSTVSQKVLKATQFIEKFLEILEWSTLQK